MKNVQFNGNPLYCCFHNTLFFQLFTMSGPIMPSASGKAWLLGRQTVGEDASDCSSQDFHSLSVYQLPGALLSRGCDQERNDG